MRIKFLRDKRAQLVQSMKTLREAAAVANRLMTDEERTQLKTLGDEFDAVTAELESEERAAEQERALTPVTAVSDGARAQAASQASAGVQVVAGAVGAEADPKRGFKDHREYLQKVMDVSLRGKVDERLKPLRAAAGSDEAGTYSDPHGGFLIPVAFSPNILSVQAEGDPTAALTRKLPMEAPMVKVNARVDKNHATSVSGGLRVYRHSETTDAPSSRQQFEQLTFAAEDLIGLAHATENQVSDSPVSFIALIADGFRDEFAAKVLNEKIGGTGAAGQYLGMLNSAAKIAVAKEAGQAAATILVENIDKMAARCWRYTSESTVYLANPTTRPQLRGLVRNIGTGGAPVAYFTESNGQERLDGRRIFFTEFAKALGTEGDLILATFSEYIEGLYQSMQQAESIHVRFAANERSFKFWVRNCGMPWWTSVLTPKNGDTLSPIVTLATRA